MAQSVASGIEVSLSLASLWFALVAQSRVNLPMTINVPCYLAIYPSIYLSILKSERIRCHSPVYFWLVLQRLVEQCCYCCCC